MKNILLTSRIGSKPSHMDGFSSSKPIIIPTASPLKEGIAALPKKKLSECRVLVVDGDSINSMLIERFLLRHKSVKYADTAENPSKALSMIGEAAKNGKYDAVFCAKNPGEGMTWLDVEEKISQISPGTLVILTSADASRNLPQDKPALLLPLCEDKLFAMLGRYFEMQKS